MRTLQTPGRTPATRRIKVVIADDHTMFRQGLGEMLTTDEDIEVIGEAKNGEEALSLASRLRPDVLLLDIEMPVMDAYGVMENLRDNLSPPKVVIVTMFENAKLVREFFDLGASGYLSKSASLKELVSAVHTAYETPADQITPAASRGSLEETNGASEKGGLSERELEILLLAARGLSNRQAAANLHLAEATIKRHLANIYAKLGVGSRSEASRKALSEGWISTHDLTRES
ncbi:MAG: response regulator [Rubrobacteraceae bacterium]